MDPSCSLPVWLLQAQTREGNFNMRDDGPIIRGTLQDSTSVLGYCFPSDIPPDHVGKVLNPRNESSERAGGVLRKKRKRETPRGEVTTQALFDSWKRKSWRERVFVWLVCREPSTKENKIVATLLSSWKTIATTTKAAWQKESFETCTFLSNLVTLARSCEKTNWKTFGSLKRCYSLAFLSIPLALFLYSIIIIIINNNNNTFCFLHSILLTASGNPTFF